MHRWMMAGIPLLHLFTWQILCVGSALANSKLSKLLISLTWENSSTNIVLSMAFQTVLTDECLQAASTLELVTHRLGDYSWLTITDHHVHFQGIRRCCLISHLNIEGSFQIGKVKVTFENKQIHWMLWPILKWSLIVNLWDLLITFVYVSIF